MKDLSREELNQAADALINWFESQDIAPPDGAVIMIDVIALQMIGKTRDTYKLAEGIALHATYLSNRISECLKNS